MRMRLPELQDNNKEAKKLKSEQILSEGWEDIKQVLHYQGLPYVPKFIYSELISRHHNNFLAGHFGIEKTRELITRKYYWPTLQQDVEAYVKGCNVYLTSKAVCYKLDRDLQSLPIPTYWWKDLSIDFVTGLSISANYKGDTISANYKGDSYNSILVIVDRLMKIVYYLPVKITIDALGLAEVIMDVVMCHHRVRSQL